MLWSAGLVKRPTRTALILATVVTVAGCGASSHDLSSSANASGATNRPTQTSTGAGTGQRAAGSTTSSKRAGNGTRTRATASASTSASDSSSASAGQASSNLPAGVIASVAGHQITLVDYHQAYGAEMKAITAGGVPLDPPGFSRCAAGLAHEYENVPKALKKLHAHRPRVPSHSALIKDCQARLRALRQGTVSQLIQQEWFQLQAQADGIHVSPAAVQAEIASERKALGGVAAYDRYLRRAGETSQQAAARIRLGLVEQRLQQRRLGPPPAISSAQIRSFFEKHHAEFVLPGDKSPKLSQYSARIRLVLAEQVRAQRAAAATTAFELRWRAQTTCRAGYIVAVCANA